MAAKKYRGSCVCGRVKFEAEFDLADGTGKCNCTKCLKRRWWSARVEPENFRAIAGQEELSGYKPGSETGHGGFCKHCGVQTYGWVDAAEWNEGAYVAISVASLDDVDPAELAAAPVQYMDGKNDSWWTAPAETRHL